MNYYDIWCNLKNSRSDLTFANNLGVFLDYLREKQLLENWQLTRRSMWLRIAVAISNACTPRSSRW